MRKLVLSIVACAVSLTLAAQQNKMRIERTDGSALEIGVNEIERVTFVEIPDTAVDLGLSVKWASFNIGATTPTERGYYFAWGETEPKHEFYYDNYAHRDKEHGLADIGFDISGTQYDAARAQWGENWRMPTVAEYSELANQCDWQWGTVDGIKGMTVTSRTTGKSIFLPTTGFCHGESASDPGYTTDNPVNPNEYGYYGISSIKRTEFRRDDEVYGSFAYYLFIWAKDVRHPEIRNSRYRTMGIPIRAVTDK